MNVQHLLLVGIPIQA